MAVLSAIDRYLFSLDELYYRARLRTRDGRLALFHKGWGSQEALDAIIERWDIAGYAPEPEIHWARKQTQSGLSVAHGQMHSSVYSDQLPAESAHANVVLVKRVSQSSRRAVLLAPTSREVGFGRRWKTAKKLATRGFSVMLLDNPFMGARAPSDQEGTVLSSFSDFPLTCAASAEECRSAISWLLANGHDHVCVSGVSQGGYCGIVAGLRSDASKVSVVAVVPPHSAEPVIDEGVPGRLCDWEALARDCGGAELARQRMKLVFDRTRIDAMPVPDAPMKIVVIGARRDKYVIPRSFEMIADHLEELVDLRWTDGGHVSAIMERYRYVDAIASMKPLGLRANA